MSGWLEMGGAPPRTTLNMARRAVAGRRFVVDWCPAWNTKRRPPHARGTPLEWVLASGGLAAALALLAEERRAMPYDFEALAALACQLAGAADAGALAAAVDHRLGAAGVPSRVGVFTDRDARDESDVHVADGVAFAILLRRSGPLFMPLRDPQISLVVPKLTTLVFPEESDANPE